MGKKKGGKGKKSAEPSMTWNEALLAYRINIKDKVLQDVKYQLRALDEKNFRSKERLTRLNKEQALYLKDLMIRAHKFEHELAEEEMVTKEQVTEVMMQNWQATREAEISLTLVKEELAHKEAEIELQLREVEYWQAYQSQGHTTQSTQIALLDAELADMDQSFIEMKAHLEGSWAKAKEEILADTEVSVDQQKYLASQRAMAKMDKYSKQEVIDNDWLTREVAIHKREVDSLMSTVEQLEKENLQMMGELFECNIEDLKISRNFFLTQFADNENLEESGILEMDLAMVVPEDTETSPEPPKPKRPKSAIRDAVEAKVFSLPSVTREETFETMEEEDMDEDQRRYELTPEQDYILSYFSFDDVHFDDYLKLGPLELKLLSISGKKMNLIPQGSAAPGGSDAKHTDALQPESWPITPRMIKQTLKPSLVSLDERTRKKAHPE